MIRLNGKIQQLNAIYLNFTFFPHTGSLFCEDYKIAFTYSDSKFELLEVRRENQDTQTADNNMA